ncbi:hypothetical protein PSDVSF_31960 [Pseudodesulfovibrio sediminis]|uniref:Uncharacterized protein n=2 Tax=Pseudodesulfovibrio sediminis TaxID=2810563 RepID=A0ABM7P976_9BACT|nr:hypothetical protein PSDVSF_31960 [Pseudodesulfovibrio sediminis]
MDIRASDASGETSSTDEVDKGTKAKKLPVSLVIPFTNETDLKQLIRVAEAKKNGTRKVYTITNRTANVAGIRQVRFAEGFSWQEKDGLHAWDVSFTLKEYLSNPERVEQRETKSASVVQTSQGKATDEITEVAGTAEAIAEPLTGLERILKFMDDFLA